MDPNNHSLTELEKLSMTFGYNLADGHARQYQTKTQAEIIARLTDIFHESERRQQSEVEEQFKHAFFELANQKHIVKPDNIKRALVCHSSSSAIEIIANFLRLNQYRTLLLEPTFDNIPSILRRHKVPLLSLDESEVLGNLDKSTHVQFDAMFLVLPNNPTGFVINKPQFTQLAHFCATYNKLLIIDACFRFYSPETLWDQYQLLDDLKVKYVIIEDTGKTWPSLDLKVGLVVTSKGVFDEVNMIHDDYLLNVSPFILALLTEYIEDTKLVGMSPTIFDIPSKNRAYLAEKIQDLHIGLTEPSSINLAWLKIHSDIDGSAVYRHLLQKKIHVLPGSQFFWNEPSKGQNYLRIALSRDPKLFSEAISIFHRVLFPLLGKD